MAPQAAVVPINEYRLTERQLKYAQNRGSGLVPSQAARAAGLDTSGGSTGRLENDPRVQAEIARWQRKTADENRVTRKKVLDGLMEAIDHAKLVNEPSSEIAGWREVAKICGFYEPIKHQLDISVNGKVTLQALQSMSDAELLALSEGTTVDGVFTQLPAVREEIQHKTDEE